MSAAPPSPKPWLALTGLLLAAFAVAAGLWLALPESAIDGAVGGGWLAWLVMTAALAGLGVQRVAALDGRRWLGSLTAALFGLWVLYFWQIGVTLFDVPRVLLPAPSFIATALVDRWDVLAGDFVQTVLKAVLTGWALGSGLGFAVGVAIDRAPFLQRGLLPLANLTSTVPLVAVAPIAVMWFGFEWPSKADRKSVV